MKLITKPGTVYWRALKTRPRFAYPDFKPFFTSLAEKPPGAVEANLHAWDAANEKINTLCETIPESIIESPWLLAAYLLYVCISPVWNAMSLQAATGAAFFIAALQFYMSVVDVKHTWADWTLRREFFEAVEARNRAFAYLTDDAGLHVPQRGWCEKYIAAGEIANSRLHEAEGIRQATLVGFIDLVFGRLRKNLRAAMFREYTECFAVKNKLGVSDTQENGLPSAHPRRARFIGAHPCERVLAAPACVKD